MASSSSSDQYFQLYDLNKLCFLAVAEQLDNRGRRCLAQTCQRFRQLLITDQRYSNPPPSPLWDESSLDNNHVIEPPRKRSRTQKMETRHPVRTMKIEQMSTSADKFLITLDSFPDSEGKWYNHRSLCINNRDQDIKAEQHHIYTNTGKIQNVIVGRFPTTINATIHEIKKYCTFERIVIVVKSPDCIQLPFMIHSLHEFSNIPLLIHSKLISGIMTEEAVRILVTNFKEMMPANGQITFSPFSHKERPSVSILTTLKALKESCSDTSTTVDWKSGPRTENPHDFFKDPITICKTVEDKLVVTYIGNFKNKF